MNQANEPGQPAAPVTRRRHVALAILLLACVLLATAVWYLTRQYRSFSRSAEDRATDELVVKAENLADYAANVLARATSVDQARQRVARDRREVFASRLTADGVIEWDAVLIGRGSSRSSWTDDETWLRTCIRLIGRPGVPATVRQTNLSCPPSVDDPRRYGPYAKTVTLPPAAS
jgi:hypothetical protein